MAAVLFARRERLKAMAEAEAQGKSFWTKEFRPELRTKFWHALEEATASRDTRDSVVAKARWLLLKDEGLFFLADRDETPLGDFFKYLMTSPSNMMPSVIESMVEGLKWMANERPGLFPWDFGQVLNNLMAEHRVSYELVNWKMVAFESKEMHQAVVKPTLQLLAGRPLLASVETAYQKSLEELSKGDAPDAITDAATALQEMLTTLGCAGGTLGAQAEVARKKGLLIAHDIKLIEWLTADRSTMGDAHNARPATRADAWFTVHIVGTVIRRPEDSVKTGNFSRQAGFLDYCLNPHLEPAAGAGGLSLDELVRRISERIPGEQQPPPFDSWFEVDVFVRLAKAGYRVLPQYEIAGYRVDLIVEGMRGRIAVECDSDCWHGEDRYDEDAARQRDLERYGLHLFGCAEPPSTGTQMPPWNRSLPSSNAITSVRPVVPRQTRPPRPFQSIWRSKPLNPTTKPTLRLNRLRWSRTMTSVQRRQQLPRLSTAADSCPTTNGSHGRCLRRTATPPPSWMVLSRL